MAKYVIRGDFGISNEIEIINAINDLNAGIDTEIIITHNTGGNAQLAIDLSRAIFHSSAEKIDVTVEAFAASAAGFVVMSVGLFCLDKLTLNVPKPCLIIYHRPRIENRDTGIAYFYLTSSICIEYDTLMHKWKNTYAVNYNDLQAYYSNHEFVFLMN